LVLNFSGFASAYDDKADPLHTMEVLGGKKI
jgi:hypothetical protein